MMFFSRQRKHERKTHLTTPAEIPRTFKRPALARAARLARLAFALCLVAPAMSAATEDVRAGGSGDSVRPAILLSDNFNPSPWTSASAGSFRESSRPGAMGRVRDAWEDAVPGVSDVVGAALEDAVGVGVGSVRGALLDAVNGRGGSVGDLGEWWREYRRGRLGEVVDSGVGVFGDALEAEAVARFGFVRTIDLEYRSGLGERRSGEIAAAALGPLRATPDSVLLWQLRLFSADEGSGGNAGILYRAALDGVMAGANVFLDYAATDDYGDFWRYGFGAELRSAWADLFFNKYEPLSDPRLATTTGGIVLGSDGVASSGGWAYTAGGFDAELHLHSPDVRWLAGVLSYYSWAGEMGQHDETGLRYGVLMRPPFAPNLQMEAEYDSPESGDDKFGGRVSYRVDLGTEAAIARDSGVYDPRADFYLAARRDYAQRIRVASGTAAVGGTEARLVRAENMSPLIAALPAESQLAARILQGGHTLTFAAGGAALRITGGPEGTPFTVSHGEAAVAADSYTLPIRPALSVRAESPAATPGVAVFEIGPAAGAVATVRAFGAGELYARPGTDSVRVAGNVQIVESPTGGVPDVRLESGVAEYSCLGGYCGSFSSDDVEARVLGGGGGSFRSGVQPPTGVIRGERDGGTGVTRLTVKRGRAVVYSRSDDGLSQVRMTVGCDFPVDTLANLRGGAVDADGLNVQTDCETRIAGVVEILPFSGPGDEVVIANHLAAVTLPSGSVTPEQPFSFPLDSELVTVRFAGEVPFAVHQDDSGDPSATPSRRLTVSGGSRASPAVVVFRFDRSPELPDRLRGEMWLVAGRVSYADASGENALSCAGNADDGVNTAGLETFYRLQADCGGGGGTPLAENIPVQYRGGVVVGGGYSGPVYRVHDAGLGTDAAYRVVGGQGYFEFREGGNGGRAPTLYAHRALPSGRTFAVAVESFSSAVPRENLPAYNRIVITVSVLSPVPLVRIAGNSGFVSGAADFAETIPGYFARSFSLSRPDDGLGDAAFEAATIDEQTGRAGVDSSALPPGPHRLVAVAEGEDAEGFLNGWSPESDGPPVLGDGRFLGSARITADIIVVPPMTAEAEVDAGFADDIRGGFREMAEAQGVSGGALVLHSDSAALELTSGGTLRAAVPLSAGTVYPATVAYVSGVVPGSGTGTRGEDFAGTVWIGAEVRVRAGPIRLEQTVFVAPFSGDFAATLRAVPGDALFSFAEVPADPARDVELAAGGVLSIHETVFPADFSEFVFRVRATRTAEWDTPDADGVFAVRVVRGGSAYRAAFPVSGVRREVAANGGSPAHGAVALPVARLFKTSPGQPEEVVVSPQFAYAVRDDSGNYNGRVRTPAGGTPYFALNRTRPASSSGMVVLSVVATPEVADAAVPVVPAVLEVSLSVFVSEAGAVPNSDSGEMEVRLSGGPTLRFVHYGRRRGRDYFLLSPSAGSPDNGAVSFATAEQFCESQSAAIPSAAELAGLFSDEAEMMVGADAPVLGAADGMVLKLGTVPGPTDAGRVADDGGFFRQVPRTDYADIASLPQAIREWRTDGLPRLSDAAARALVDETLLNWFQGRRVFGGATETEMRAATSFILQAANQQAPSSVEQRRIEAANAMDSLLALALSDPTHLVSVPVLSNDSPARLVVQVGAWTSEVMADPDDGSSAVHAVFRGGSSAGFVSLPGNRLAAGACVRSAAAGSGLAALSGGKIFTPRQTVLAAGVLEAGEEWTFDSGATLTVAARPVSGPEDGGVLDLSGTGRFSFSYDPELASAVRTGPFEVAVSPTEALLDSAHYTPVVVGLSQESGPAVRAVLTLRGRPAAGREEVVVPQGASVAATLLRGNTGILYRDAATGGLTGESSGNTQALSFAYGGVRAGLHVLYTWEDLPTTETDHQRTATDFCEWAGADWRLASGLEYSAVATPGLEFDSPILVGGFSNSNITLSSWVRSRDGTAPPLVLSAGRYVVSEWAREGFRQVARTKAGGVNYAAFGSGNLRAMCVREANPPTYVSPPVPVLVAAEYLSRPSYVPTGEMTMIAGEDVPLAEWTSGEWLALPRGVNVVELLERGFGAEGTPLLTVRARAFRYGPEGGTILVSGSEGAVGFSAGFAGDDPDYRLLDLGDGTAEVRLRRSFLAGATGDSQTIRIASRAGMWEEHRSSFEYDASSQTGNEGTIAVVREVLADADWGGAVLTADAWRSASATLGGTAFTVEARAAVPAVPAGGRSAEFAPGGIAMDYGVEPAGVFGTEALLDGTGGLAMSVLASAPGDVLGRLTATPRVGSEAVRRAFPGAPFNLTTRLEILRVVRSRPSRADLVVRTEVFLGDLDSTLGIAPGDNVAAPAGSGESGGAVYNGVRRGLRFVRSNDVYSPDEFAGAGGDFCEATYGRGWRAPSLGEYAGQTSNAVSGTMSDVLADGWEDAPGARGTRIAFSAESLRRRAPEAGRVNSHHPTFIAERDSQGRPLAAREPGGTGGFQVQAGHSARAACVRAATGFADAETRAAHLHQVDIVPASRAGEAEFPGTRAGEGFGFVAWSPSRPDEALDVVARAWRYDGDGGRISTYPKGAVALGLSGSPAGFEFIPAEGGGSDSGALILTEAQTRNGATAGLAAEFPHGTAEATLRVFTAAGGELGVVRWLGTRRGLRVLDAGFGGREGAALCPAGFRLPNLGEAFGLAADGDLGSAGNVPQRGSDDSREIDFPGWPENTGMRLSVRPTAAGDFGAQTDGWIVSDGWYAKLDDDAATLGAAGLRLTVTRRGDGRVLCVEPVPSSRVSEQRSVYTPPILPVGTRAVGGAGTVTVSLVRPTMTVMLTVNEVEISEEIAGDVYADNDAEMTLEAWRYDVSLNAIAGEDAGVGNPPAFSFGSGLAVRRLSGPGDVLFPPDWDSLVGRAVITANLTARASRPGGALTTTIRFAAGERAGDSGAHDEFAIVMVRDPSTVLFSAGGREFTRLGQDVVFEDVPHGYRHLSPLATPKDFVMQYQGVVRGLRRFAGGERLPGGGYGAAADGYQEEVCARMGTGWRLPTIGEVVGFYRDDSSATETASLPSAAFYDFGDSVAVPKPALALGSGHLNVGGAGNVPAHATFSDSYFSDGSALAVSVAVAGSRIVKGGAGEVVCVSEVADDYPAQPSPSAVSVSGDGVARATADGTPGTGAAVLTLTAHAFRYGRDGSLGRADAGEMAFSASDARFEVVGTRRGGGEYEVVLRMTNLLEGPAQGEVVVSATPAVGTAVSRRVSVDISRPAPVLVFRGAKVFQRGQKVTATGVPNIFAGPPARDVVMTYSGKRRGMHYLVSDDNFADGYQDGLCAPAVGDSAGLRLPTLGEVLGLTSPGNVSEGVISPAANVAGLADGARVSLPPLGADDAPARFGVSGFADVYTTDRRDNHYSAWGWGHGEDARRRIVCVVPESGAARGADAAGAEFYVDGQAATGANIVAARGAKITLEIVARRGSRDGPQDAPDEVLTLEPLRGFTANFGAATLVPVGGQPGRVRLELEVVRDAGRDGYLTIGVSPRLGGVSTFSLTFTPPASAGISQ